MNGAIIYASTYGSTRQYADWIADETGLPQFDYKSPEIDLAQFDLVVIGSPIYYYKPVILRWLNRHLVELGDKTVLLFTVSGAGAGAKLDAWLADSLPTEFIANTQHFPLPGRMNPARLSLFHRMMLRIGSLFNSDPRTRKDELEGFDHMDRSSIAALVATIRRLQTSQQFGGDVGRWAANEDLVLERNS